MLPMKDRALIMRGSISSDWRWPCPGALLALAAALLALPVVAGAEVAVQVYSLPADGGRSHPTWPSGPDASSETRRSENARSGRLDPATKVDLIALGDRLRSALGSSSVPTARRGLPTAASTPSSASIPDPRGQALAAAGQPRGYVNLNTATFDKHAESGSRARTVFYGRLDPANGRAAGPRSLRHCDHARRGRLLRLPRRQPHRTVDLETGAATVIEPPTKDQRARVWSDLEGRHLGPASGQRGPGEPVPSENQRLARLATAWREAPRLIGSTSTTTTRCG